MEEVMARTEAGEGVDVSGDAEMDGVIPAGLIEDDADLSDVYGDEEEEEAAPEEEVAEESDPEDADIPENLRGKTKAELAAIAVEMRREIGRLGQELGTRRSEVQRLQQGTGPDEAALEREIAEETQKQLLIWQQAGLAPEQYDTTDPQFIAVWNTIYNLTKDRLTTREEVRGLRTALTQTQIRPQVHGAVQKALKDAGVAADVTPNDIYKVFKPEFLGQQFADDPEVMIGLVKMQGESLAYRKSRTQPTGRRPIPTGGPSVQAGDSTAMPGTQIPSQKMRDARQAVARAHPSLVEAYTTAVARGDAKRAAAIKADIDEVATAYAGTM
jgi:hypothetical protein